MWLPNDIVAQVDNAAMIHYVDMDYAARWNKYRKGNELRMLTGWAWVSKHNAQYRYGFKSKTVCYRDAWYTLINRSRSPVLTIREARK